MKNSGMCALMVLALGFVSSPASAVCTIDDRTKLIYDGVEAEGSVPNYHSGDFAGNNDCGPVAFTMIAGYWDANGWPGLVSGRSTYWGESATPGLTELHQDLKDELGYSRIRGTWPWEVWAPVVTGNVGRDARRAYDNNESGVASWDYEDRDWVTKASVRQEVGKDRPVALMVTLPDFLGYVGEWLGIDPDGPEWTGSHEEGYYGEQVINRHWMPILGYRDHVLGRGPGDYCWDTYAFDDFYIVTRSGWRRGGDARVTYNWSGLDLADFYTVSLIPDGEAELPDPIDLDGDGFGGDQDLLDRLFNGGLGLTPGTDCDDQNDWIHPGAYEECDGLDNDCDGAIDEGSPDWDDDGVRNECDPDDDNDGVNDDDDNCPFGSNSSQADADSDGIGDPCDFCPADSANDWDDDGVCGDEDNCPSNSNAEQLDLDADGRGDACDLDLDGDGNPNLNDYDDDGDGVLDTDDNCPRVPNSNQVDHDNNGLGIACDDEEALNQLISRMDALIDSFKGDLQYVEIERLRDGWRPPTGPGCPACEAPWKDTYSETYAAAPKLVSTLLAKDNSLSGEDLLSVLIEIEPDLEPVAQAYFMEEGFLDGK